MVAITGMATLLDGGNKKGTLINCPTMGWDSTLVEGVGMIGGVHFYYELGEIGVYVEDDATSLVERTQTDSYGVIDGGPW